jgi:hypothetical protein
MVESNRCESGEPSSWDRRPSPCPRSPLIHLCSVPGPVSTPNPGARKRPACFDI